MKKIVLAIGCASLLWASCKENNPAIDFGQTSVSDTMYILPASQIPTADARQVLIEEFTGQSCAPCVAANAVVESQETAHPGMINVIGLFITDYPQTNVPHGGTYDFRDSIASDLGAGLYGGIGGIPIAGIDRTPVSSSIQIPSGNWPGTITTQLALTTPLNIKLESVYDAASNTATITAKVTYVTQVDVRQNLTIAVVEDGMIDLHEAPVASFPSGIDSTFEYNNVLRGLLTAKAGDPLGSEAVKVAGTVFVRVYSYHPKTITPAIVPANCKVVAFVSNDGTGGDYKVVQSGHIKLK